MTLSHDPAALSGFVLCLLGGLGAVYKGRRGALTWWEREVYHMSPRSNVRFGIFYLALAGLFALILLGAPLPSVIILAVAVVSGILYVSSFARGAGDD
ncbi:MAG TPA: hypothetical protein VNJ51_05985 [Candidatus Dormibacteraeota bacterium]|nr:hypothetical protein [Candidatus Dormibacteraeota bacterium]